MSERIVDGSDNRSKYSWAAPARDNAEGSHPEHFEVGEKQLWQFIGLSFRRHRWLELCQTSERPADLYP